MTSPLSEEIPATPPALPPPPDAGPTASADDVVPAGFIRRWAALFIDGFVLVLPVMLILFIAAFGMAFANMGLGTTDPAGAASVVLTLVVYAVYFIASALYFAGMESSRHQATLGKLALGIKVTDDAGRRLSFSHAIGRWFSTSLSYLTLYIGFLMAAFTDRKRALHDMVSATQVVDRWAYTESPERQSRKTSGCLIALVVGVLLIIPIGAIFAAIAVSQYQDYVIRSQVAEGVALADGVKTAVAEYYSNKGAYPMANADAGLPEPAQIAGAYVSGVDAGNGRGEIRVSYSAAAPQRANSTINGAVLEFNPEIQGGDLHWNCRSDNLRQKACPTSCSCKR